MAFWLWGSTESSWLWLVRESCNFSGSCTLARLDSPHQPEDTLTHTRSPLPPRHTGNHNPIPPEPICPLPLQSAALCRGAPRCAIFLLPVSLRCPTRTHKSSYCETTVQFRVHSASIMSLKQSYIGHGSGGKGSHRLSQPTRLHRQVLLVSSGNGAMVDELRSGRAEYHGPVIDPPLSQSGATRAIQAGEAVRQVLASCEWEDPLVAVVSPLTRSLQTADAVLPPSTRFVLAPRLSNLDSRGYSKAAASRSPTAAVAAGASGHWQEADEVLQQRLRSMR